MHSGNEFPESAEKAYLRHVHLKQLGQRYAASRRHQAYFGMPAVEMLDVRLWKPYLGHVTAVERDKTTALFMYQTAMKLGVREKTIVLERELSEVARLLAMDERDIGATVSRLTLSEQNDLRRARSIGYDIMNLDFYGGFLYPNGSGVSATADLLEL